MTNHIKTAIIMFVVIIVFTISCCYIIRSCQQCVEQAGGLRQIIVDTGKEVKSIYKDINTDEHTN